MSCSSPSCATPTPAEEDKDPLHQQDKDQPDQGQDGQEEPSTTSKSTLIPTLPEDENGNVDQEVAVEDKVVMISSGTGCGVALDDDDGGDGSFTVAVADTEVAEKSGRIGMDKSRAVEAHREIQVQAQCV